MSHAGLNDGTMVPYVVCILLLLSTVPTTREDSSKSAPEASEGSKIPECVTGDKYLDCSNINVELSRTSLVLYDGQKDGGALLRSILDIEKGSSFVLSVVTTSKSRGRGISSCPFSILRNPRTDGSVDSPLAIVPATQSWRFHPLPHSIICIYIYIVGTLDVFHQSIFYSNTVADL